MRKGLVILKRACISSGIYKKRRMLKQMMLEPEMEENFLVIRMGLFTSLQKVKSYFERYGKVVQVNAIHDGASTYNSNSPVLNFTRCCEVRMNITRLNKLKILKKKFHSLHKLNVFVKRYKGREAHRTLFSKGGYQLVVNGFTESKDDYYVIRFIEKTLNQCGVYNRIKITKGSERQFIGTARIRFLREKDAEAAQKVFKEAFNCVAFTKLAKHLREDSEQEEEARRSVTP